MIKLVLCSTIFLLFGKSIASSKYQLSRTEASKNYVILLHGLRGESSDFLKMEKALLAAGFNVCRVDYPSTKDTIPVLADSSIGQAIFQCEKAGCDTLFFVAHSMGCILARYYLQENEVPTLGRVVFISPPNYGIELIDKFAWSRLFRKFNGPGGMQLGAANDGFVRSLEKPDYEFGVIMSSRSINPVASIFIPGADDGRVSIESARLEGMADFILVASNHHVIMKKEKTIQQVIQFLKCGRFFIEN